MDDRTKAELQFLLTMVRNLAATGLLKLGEGLAQLSKAVRGDQKV